MYAEFVEQFQGYPQVILYQGDKRPDSSTGYVMVTSLHLNLDAGKYTLSPKVDVNVSLGKMTARAAEEWAEILKVASLIARRVDMAWLDKRTLEAGHKFWARTDEIIGATST